MVARVSLAEIEDGLKTIAQEGAMRLVVDLGDMLHAIAIELGIVDEIEFEAADALLFELDEDGRVIVAPIDEGIFEIAGAIAIMRRLQLELIQADAIVGGMFGRDIATARERDRDRQKREEPKEPKKRTRVRH